MLKSTAIRLTGQRFGDLVVIEQAGNIGRGGRSKGNAVWKCRCDCGQEVNVRSDHLRLKRRARCNLNGHDFWSSQQPSLARQHRAEHSVWERMKERCQNSRNAAYVNYGGRSITVCERWRSFANFFADMGRRPSPQHSIERKDVNGNYEPENCCWVTMAEQRRNMRCSIYVDYEGERMLLIDVIAKLGVSNSAVRSRLQMGWTLADALTIPVRPKKKNRKNLRKTKSG